MNGEKSFVRNFSAKGWQEELRASDLSPFTKVKLEAVLLLKLAQKEKGIPLTEKEFYKIVDEDLISLKIGDKQFLLVYKKKQLKLEKEGE